MSALNLIKKETLGELFLKFIGSSQNCIFILADKEGKVLYCNCPFSSQVKEKPEEIVGTNLYEYLVGCDRNQIITLIQDLFKNREPFKRYLHVAGSTSLPRTYHFLFFHEGGLVLAAGEPEIESLEHGQRSLMEINNKLLRLHRDK